LATNSRYCLIALIDIKEVAPGDQFERSSNLPLKFSQQKAVLAVNAIGQIPATEREAAKFRATPMSPQ